MPFELFTEKVLMNDWHKVIERDKETLSVKELRAYIVRRL
jgi:hypothetical protein